MNPWLELLCEASAFCYCFLGLALICDGFLILSLETMCVRWRLREDVAGATLMALGSAAPEIVVNMVSTIKSSTNVDSTNLGVGAIMGSGVVAFSVIPAFCALFAKQPLRLKRRPLLRDMLTYATALGVLCFMFIDGKIALNESVSLLALYAGYIAVVVVAPHVRRWYRKRILGRRLGKLRSFVEEREENQSGTVREETQATCQSPLIQEGTSEYYGMSNGQSLNVSGMNGLVDTQESSEEAEEAEVYYGERQDRMRSEGLSQDFIEVSAEPQSSVASKVLNVVSWPLKSAFALTCPPCYRETAWEVFYPLTFAVSIGWVTLFSYGLSHIVERWEGRTNLKLSFFGFVLVASGAEIPDMIQSVTVARRGYGSMAVSNAIGSQIINICVGLGLPWTITILGGGSIVVTDHEEIYRFALLQALNVAVVFIALIGMATIFQEPKAVLSKGKAGLLLFNYVAIVAAVSYFSFR